MPSLAKPTAREPRGSSTATAASPDERPETKGAVALQPSAYVLCWWFVLAMHLATSVFVIVAAFVHLALSIPIIHDNTPALLLTISLKRVSGLSYLTIAILHLRGVIHILYHSARARQLVFSHDATPKTSSKILSRQRFGQKGFLRFLWKVLRGVFLALFGSEGFFGINGRFFNVFVLLREVVEIGLQTYQLWTLSHAVSRVWINTFAVATVIANCWSVPLVHVVYRNHEPTRRLAHLVADMVLDFVCAIVVPVCVMVPYLLDFDWVKRDFPPELMANDLWFANAVAEGRQVLVTSYLDLFSSLLPQYGIYACLRLLKRLIVRPTTLFQSSHRNAVVPIASPTAVSIANDNREDGSVRVKALSYVIGVWGWLVLVLHIQTSLQTQHTTIPGCLLYLRPWFSSKVPCAVLYMNCYRLGINGTATETSAMLSQLERSVTTRVIFAHCPALTVPPEILSLYALTGVLMYNSTLIEWSSQAAIKQSTHPAFIGVIFGSSTINHLPDGLFHNELPRGMTSLAYHNCSIAQLPENIGDVWGTSALHRLNFESTHLLAIPASLGRLPLTQLLLTDNHIEELPPDLLTTLRLTVLSVSGNPLKQLPVNGGDTAALRELLMEYTNVSTLPPWVRSWQQTQEGVGASSFFGSPLCDQANGSVLCAKDRGSTGSSIRSKLIQHQYPL